MEKKLEITNKLEALAKDGMLDSRITILNLPSANYCEKRAERIIVEGNLQQSCCGCVTQGIKPRDRLGIDRIKEVIDFFALQFDTQFITINGRGDPFHPKLRHETLEKIRYAYDKWRIQAYVFTAGNNLDVATCRVLSDNRANVMISLFGNRFIDADFFAGKKYLSAPKPLQNQAEIAANLRRLIEIYSVQPHQPEKGATRIGMNYVVSQDDLNDCGAKLAELKQSANNAGVFFVCNTNFEKHRDEDIQNLLEQMANQYSDFYLRHSTAVNGQCQMGAGSSATVDYDGTLLRCPYMDNSDGDGIFQNLLPQQVVEILKIYMNDRQYSCIMRKHEKPDCI